MKIGLETESYHLFFQQGKMDIFDFIDKAWSLGLDGVEINIIPDEGLHPEFGVLSSDDPTYLARVRHAIEQRNLYCESIPVLRRLKRLVKPCNLHLHWVRMLFEPTCSVVVSMSP